MRHAAEHRNGYGSRACRGRNVIVEQQQRWLPQTAGMFHRDDRRCVQSQKHPPQSLSTPPFPINMPPGWPTPPGSNPSVWGNWSVKTNGEKLPSSEDAAGAALSKSHFTLLLSLSHIFTTISPLQALATLTTGGKSRALQGLVCYQRTPALKWAGTKSGLCLLEAISLVVCVSPR